MEGQLTHLVRDPSGAVHKPHTVVSVVGEWRELGTHRRLLRVLYSDTHSTGVLLPDDVTFFADER